MKHNSISRLPTAGILPILLGLIVLLETAAPVQAGGTVENCSDDSAFNSVLIGGGTVTFNCGDREETATIALSSTKTISVDTTIDGGGKVTLSGAHAMRLFEVGSGVTLSFKNIVLANGYGSFSDGGTIYNAGHLILDNTTIRDAGNSNFYGGAIATIGAVDVTNSTFLNNEGGSAGAIYANGAGAVVTIAGSLFQDNSVISTNPDSNRGGAIFVANGATINLSSSQVLSNTGAYGSGIAVDNGSVTLSDVTLAYNKSTGNGNGGGIYNLGTADLTDVRFLQNSIRTGDGGGLYNKGTATLSRATMFQNSSSYGGGIANDHGTLTVTDSTFMSNSANVAGGGGIANEFGTMTLTNLTVAGNAASGDAGGVENGRGTATLTNVTISGNFASSGGGMWNLYGGTANLTNVTIFGNSAYSSAGGIGNTLDADTHLYLTNVIIANNKQSDNCNFQKAPENPQANLSSDASCAFGPGRDSVKVKLGPLETNGGALLTHRPLFGSPAIDGGTDTGCPSTDERGAARVQGALCDVGAVEILPCPGAPTKPVLSLPANKAKVKTAEVPLDWLGPDCAKKFNVVVRQDSTAGPVVFGKDKLKPSEVTTVALPRQHTYFWQVTACNAGGCTASDWWKFKVK